MPLQGAGTARPSSPKSSQPPLVRSSARTRYQFLRAARAGHYQAKLVAVNVGWLTSQTPRSSSRRSRQVTLADSSCSVFRFEQNFATAVILACDSLGRLRRPIAQSPPRVAPRVDKQSLPLAEPSDPSALFRPTRKLRSNASEVWPSARYRLRPLRCSNLLARGAKGAGHPRQDGVNGQPEELLVLAEAGRLPRGGTSRMTREGHVRICGRLGVKFPGPTRRDP